MVSTSSIYLAQLLTIIVNRGLLVVEINENPGRENLITIEIVIGIIQYKTTMKLQNTKVRAITG